MFMVAPLRNHAIVAVFITKELSKFLTQELLELVKQITGESALKGILRPLELNYHLTTI